MLRLELRGLLDIVYCGCDILPRQCEHKVDVDVVETGFPGLTDSASNIVDVMDTTNRSKGLGRKTLRADR